MKALKILIATTIILLFSGCSFLSSAYDVADDYIDISWKKDKNKEQVIIDSIVIKFDMVYWKEESSDTNSVNIERDFDQNGYNVWILKTKGIRYNEIRKKDTVIYIYKAKK